MRYAVCGPFEVARNGHLVSRYREDKQAFWGEVEAFAEGLSQACGCYIFLINKRAWYVGLAEKQSFRKECFTSHKVVQYCEALGEVQGVPKLLFIARLTPSAQFCAPSKNGHRDIRALEKILIGSAITNNSNLRNIKNTKLLREMNVPGVLNSKQGQGRATSVQLLKKSLGMG